MVEFQLRDLATGIVHTHDGRRFESDFTFCERGLVWNPRPTFERHGLLIVTCLWCISERLYAGRIWGLGP